MRRDRALGRVFKRLGRSLSFLIELIEKLRNNEAGFESLSDGINTMTAGGKLVFHILSALTEFERALISERLKAGMRAARKREKHLGRPVKLSQEQISHAAGMIREERETVSGMAGLPNVDRTTLHQALKRKVKTGYNTRDSEVDFASDQAYTKAMG